MGGGRVALMVAPVILLVAVVAAMQSAEATTYKVGGDQGWKIPSDPSFYSTWASGIAFHVNDVLEFDFGSVHTVAVVSKEEYDGCVKNTSNVLKTSPAIVPLIFSGKLYFICTTGTHCSSGQKLAVTVNAGTSAPPSDASSLGPVSAISVIFGLVFVVVGFLHY